ncbi:MAG: hypothetical protein DRJ42_01775 [Deltaproteobacteria bacterium]|nr:MAG: hypothetical protein DRJ42_01775 [Deltaproteobacteria bacterium]
MGCTESTSADPFDASTGQTTVDLRFFDAVYAGAEVCVADTCGVLGEIREVGELEELVVTPPIVGSVLPVTVTRGEATVTIDRGFGPDVLALGLDPEAARTDRVSIALYADASGDCALYLTTHVIEGLSVFSSPPSDTELATLCGPFAAR